MRRSLITESRSPRINRTAWLVSVSVTVQGGVGQLWLPALGGSDCAVSRSFSFGHHVADVVTTNGSLISGTGSVAAADAPLMGSVAGSALEAATVEGSDQRIRRPEELLTGTGWPPEGGSLLV